MVQSSALGGGRGGQFDDVQSSTSSVVRGADGACAGHAYCWTAAMVGAALGDPGDKPDEQRRNMALPHGYRTSEDHPAVGDGRHRVCLGRRWWRENTEACWRSSRPRRATVLAPLLVLLGCLLAACGDDPEQLLLGRWQEVDWRYEKLDPVEGTRSERPKWKDGVKFPRPSRDIVRHEAEYWQFLPGRTLRIVRRDGGTLLKRWRLKGRGHILTVRSLDSNDLELYDIKELDRDQLVLHYDIGMEVRGVAKLVFGRTVTVSNRTPARDDDA